MSLPNLDDVKSTKPMWAEKSISIFQNQESYTFRNVFESSRLFNSYIDLTFWYKSGELERTGRGLAGKLTDCADIPLSCEDFNCDADARLISARLDNTVYWTFANDEEFWIAVCLLWQAVNYVPKAVCMYDGFTRDVSIPAQYSCNISLGYKSQTGILIEKYNDRGRKVDEIRSKHFELSYDTEEFAFVTETFYSDHIDVNKDYCFQDWSLYMSANPGVWKLLIEDDFGEFSIWTFKTAQDYLSTLSYIKICIDM